MGRPDEWIGLPGTGWPSRGLGSGSLHAALAVLFAFKLWPDCGSHSKMIYWYFCFVLSVISTKNRAAV